MYDSEVSFSSSLITKLLANIGVTITNVAVRILPWEFGKEHSNLDALPTLLFRLSYFKFWKNEDEPSDLSSNSEAESTQNFYEIKTPQTDISNKEEPLPKVLLILKKKSIKLGQISLHLLSSPFCNEAIQKLGDNECEFPYQLPKIQNVTTILWIGDPENSLTASFEISLNQSKTNKRKFEINSTLPYSTLSSPPLCLVPPVSLGKSWSLTISLIKKNLYWKF